MLGDGGVVAQWDQTLSARLADGDPAAIIELYDEIAPRAYGFALHLTGSKTRACAALRDAFLHAVHEPAIFADRGLSSGARILLEVNHYALHEPGRRSRSAACRARGCSAS